MAEFSVADAITSGGLAHVQARSVDFLGHVEEWSRWDASASSNSARIHRLERIVLAWKSRTTETPARNKPTTCGASGARGPSQRSK
jgi:hypothetical protein